MKKAGDCIVFPCLLIQATVLIVSLCLFTYIGTTEPQTNLNGGAGMAQW